MKKRKVLATPKVPLIRGKHLRTIGLNLNKRSNPKGTSSFVLKPKFNNNKTLNQSNCSMSSDKGRGTRLMLTTKSIQKLQIASANIHPILICCTT